jgi:uncharacterized membrane protein
MRRWLLPLLIGGLIALGAYKATLLATPFALMRVAMKKIGGPEGQVNRFNFRPMATAVNQPIVRPSPDLAYATCAFDLSKGPVLVRVEPVPEHYWSVSVFDARTDVAAVRSDRDTGGKAALLALGMKGQRAPDGYEFVQLGYAKGIVLIRILLKNSAEFETIDAVRRRSTCGPA